MSILSTSLSRIKESPTIAITQKARLLKESGKEVIALASGEPDFDTPDNIKAAAIKAIKEGQTKYTAVDGTPELKKAIVNKFKKENNLSFDVDNITVGTGGKQVIYNCILATINPGDEVIIPAPYWVSYPDMVLLAGGTPKFVECDERSDFKISADQLDKMITTKTKWFILNSPGNPTGMCYSRSELTELAKVLKKHKHVNILTDDIYEHIIYQDKGSNDSKFVNILEIDNSLSDRTLVVNGVSKAYAMTGWRIGYAAGSKTLIKAIQKIQSQSTTNPSSISQAAAVEALNGDQSFINPRAIEFKKRRDFVVSSLNNTKGLTCVNPQGAFYVFPNCKKLMNKKTSSGKIIKNDTDFATYLLEETGVAIVQGSAFGLEGYFRISYATSMQILEKAVAKIKSFCESLK
ncbi:MAG: pyridoxal phosphate-dependent aminotransferase [Proteobacteria bacterium]|uniref:Aminotransferase n=1 Tax=Candidatus Fonsibacter lacus TaxID=2576439 RepID=A0A964V2L9_9PROT|nr:pyridoxal phosphate-dependent aminotransferase [Candidatus Fonsibacter lacus]NBP59735.1 pyridoxal phosphate-dependent aminotransferase [Pseudomonadota bacterium]NBP99749.1 pyridoxal phosphate-dependent aminotransferase [Pseudomonadota bacterium]NCU71880.1 pyridoxal phosphate-dependent aminotransferase [Candidatus Fonsibacter lacus]